jgi:tetratricopeptide (TPR) repeat protein
LREKVLAKALLEQIDPTLEEILRRGLVFELPVPRDALAAVCEKIPNLDQQINRAVALGLLEVSPDKSLRVPRILPLKLPKDAESLYKQAAEVLYRLWCEEAETPTEEQQLEIHRLALRGKVEKIAVEIATSLTDGWYYPSRFLEVVEVCRGTLEIVENYRLLQNLALSEKELGWVDKALEHHQQVLNLCPPEDEIQKAATLHQLGYLKANTGQIEEAIALYQQSLEINERIDNVQGKAVALHCLGELKANSGQIEEAIALYQQSLEIFERIGDAQGKAATLHGLGILKANSGQIEEAIALYQQSLEINERIGYAQGKAMTLWSLGHIAEQQGDSATALNYLQQSLEILQRIQSPHAETVREAIATVQQMRDEIP